MQQPFFPDPVFGWICYAVLVGTTGMAAWVDYRTRVIPKWITLTALPLGFLANLVRGAWLGSSGQSVWVLGPGLWYGLLDGLLFASSGFLLAFVLFFVIWLLGSGGGGDVKLFAAVGAWVGARLVLWILFVSAMLLLVVTVFLLLGSIVTRGASRTVRDYSRAASPSSGGQPRKRIMSYAPVVALSAALVLLWNWRVDLKVAAPVVSKGFDADVRSSQGATDALMCVMARQDGGRIFLSAVAER
ncbi:MAG: hypothetical protein C4297_01205 [Gemmataceae bacterium]